MMSPPTANAGMVKETLFLTAKILGVLFNEKIEII